MNTHINIYIHTYIRISYLCSNMSSKMFYAALGVEILRIARTATETVNV